VSLPNFVDSTQLSCPSQIVLGLRAFLLQESCLEWSFPRHSHLFRSWQI